MKKQLNLRASALTHRQINSIKLATGMNKSEIVALAIDRMAKQEAEVINVLIKHEHRTGSESGYGLYINGYIHDTKNDPPDEAHQPVIWAFECIPHDSSVAEIKSAERRVRTNARRRYLRERA